MALSGYMIANDPGALYVPMIDARRMEVFTAVYNYKIEEINAPYATVLNEDSFSDILSTKKIFFLGSGISKFQPLCNNPNCFFLNVGILTESLAKISMQKFENKYFVYIPYAKPLYIKDFHTILNN